MLNQDTPLDQDQKAALAMLAYFYLQHEQPDKACVLLEALIALWPEDAYLARTLSYTYLKLGRYENALTVSTVLEQGTGMMHLLRSKALWGLGQTEKAQAELSQYLEQL